MTHSFQFFLKTPKVVRQRTDGVPSGVAVHVVERSKDIVRPTRPPPSTASSLVLAEEKQAACCESCCHWPMASPEAGLRAFCRRLLCASRTPWACCSKVTDSCLEKARRSREPASSLTRTQIPARHGTGGAESTQAMGKAAAEMCSVTGTTMAAELLRSTTAIHHFATHAARTQRIWLKTLSNAATSG